MDFQEYLGQFGRNGKKKIHFGNILGRSCALSFQKMPKIAQVENFCSEYAKSGKFLNVCVYINLTNSLSFPGTKNQVKIELRYQKISGPDSVSLTQSCQELNIQLVN